MNPERFSELVSELVNSLQTAVLLSARLERDMQLSAHDAHDLHAAVERAASAAQLRKPSVGDDNSTREGSKGEPNA
jgi:hypothetical protein